MKGSLGEYRIIITMIFEIVIIEFIIIIIISPSFDQV